MLRARLKDCRGDAPFAVGLESIQCKFQSTLDAFSRGDLTLAELRTSVEWDTRWGWPFERYAPVFSAAKEAGATLLALNVDSEDLMTVQQGGIPALGPARMAKVTMNKMRTSQPKCHN
jgi:uncharacterized iron-regulated protein